MPPIQASTARTETSTLSTVTPETRLARAYMGHVAAYGLDVAAANDTRPVDGMSDTLLVVPGEPQPIAWRHALRLDVRSVVLLPRGAESLSHMVADAARTVTA